MIATILSTLLLSSLIILPLYLFFNNSKPFHTSSPTQIKGLPIFGSLKYFTKRYDFWFDCVKRSKTGIFVFRLANYKVVGMSGKLGRDAFFNTNFSFQAGYAVLFGASPALGEGLSTEDDPHFNRRIIFLLKKENLSKTFDLLISDTITRLEELGSEGITDPFESIYAIVFQLTMRTVGVRDIAEDRVLLDRMLYLYEEVERSATATALLFPWAPSPAKIRKTYAGAQIYMIFQKIVDGRKKLGKVEDDPLQYLIDEGDNIREIMTFLIGALFAGLLNSGINASFVLCYLALSPKWTAIVQEEIKSVALKYSPVNNTLTLVEQLTYVTQEAYETEFPMIEICLKDSIRLHLQGAALRMNITGKPVVLANGEVVDAGDIIAYHLADLHMDPEIYPNPEQWDPARYLPDAPPVESLAWGAGRHKCVGMRFAKLEQNIITANFMARFDYSLTDKEGTPLTKLPAVNPQNHMATKPSKGEEVYLKYKLRKE